MKLSGHAITNDYLMSQMQLQKAITIYREKKEKKKSLLLSFMSSGMHAGN